MIDTWKGGDTSALADIWFFSQSTGYGITGLSSSSPGLTCYYHRDTSNSNTPVSLSTGTLGSYTSGLLYEIDRTNSPGLYQFGLPNAAIAGGAKEVTFYFQGAADLVPSVYKFKLIQVDSQNPTNFGLGAIPNVSTGSVGALLVGGTGTSAINTSSGNITVAGYVSGQDPLSLLTTDSTKFSGSYIAEIPLIKGQTDQMNFQSGLVAATVSGFTLSNSALQTLANNIFNFTIDGTWTMQMAQEAMLAVLVGRTIKSGTDITFRNPQDTMNRIVASVDSSGQRILVSYNFSS